MKLKKWLTHSGMTEEKHLNKYNKVLEIHHKDHNRKNCSEDNLITLCKRCNIKDNRKKNQ
jgi:5-methylcytosine-specific restriction endonuclease McrA